MPLRPSEFPQWDENDTNTTAPIDEKADGWDPAELPRADYDNWFKRLAWLWLLFLDAVRLVWSDFGEDHVVPGSVTLPTTGVGLTGTTGALTVYRQDRRLLGVSEGRAYSANTDAYVYLSRDAEWVIVEVAAGDPAPSTPANTRPAFKVTTDATDRTAAVLLSTADDVPISQPWTFRKRVRAGDSYSASAATAPTVAAYEATYNASTNAVTAVSDVRPRDGASNTTHVRRFVCYRGAGVIESWEVINASYSTTTGWTQDDASQPSARTIRGSMFRVQKKDAGAAPWTIDAWDTLATIDAAGITIPDSARFRHATAAVRAVLLPGSAGIQAPDSNGDLNFAIDGPHHAISRDGGFLTSGLSAEVHYLIDLPPGSVITSASWIGANNTVQNVTASIRGHEPASGDTNEAAATTTASSVNPTDVHDLALPDGGVTISEGFTYALHLLAAPGALCDCRAVAIVASVPEL